MLESSVKVLLRGLPVGEFKLFVPVKIKLSNSNIPIFVSDNIGRLLLLLMLDSNPGIPYHLYQTPSKLPREVYYLPSGLLSIYMLASQLPSHPQCLPQPDHQFVYTKNQLV